jgi:hypothetical protein
MKVRAFVMIAALLASTSAFAQSGGRNLGTSYVGQVATKTGIIAANDTSGPKQIMSRTMHQARQPLTSFKVVFPNYWMNSSGQEVGSTGLVNNFPSASVAASIEYPPGTCTQILFSGVATGTMATGVFSITSDAITLNIPSGAFFGVRTFWQNTGGSAGILTGGAITWLGDAGIPTAAGGVDLTVTCATFNGTTGLAPAGSVIVPLAIVATTNQPAVCFIGDSISSGTTPGFLPDGTSGITAPLVNGSFGTIDISHGSMSATLFSAVASTAPKLALYQYCTILLDQLGINDVGASGAAAIEASMQTIYSAFSANSAPPGQIVKTTLTPHTTSTDSWATTVNQTVISAPAETSRTQLNADIRAKTFFTGDYLDVAAVTGTPTPNFQFWRNPVSHPSGCPLGPGFAWTDDGLHPNACAAKFIYLNQFPYPVTYFLHR